MDMNSTGKFIMHRTFFNRIILYVEVKEIGRYPYYRKAHRSEVLLFMKTGKVV